MNLQLSVSCGSIESYVNAANTIPVLSAERERELFDQFKTKDDLEAARELVLSHVRFVVKVARGYSGYGLPQADLIQEGTMGLMKAVKRFDPEYGVRLVSFAVHWIRAEIHEYILRNWRIVKVATTKAQRKLFFNLRSSKKRLGWLNRHEVESVARDLGVSSKDVLEMEKRMSSYDASLNSETEGSENDTYSPVIYIEDKRNGPEQELEAKQTKALNAEKLNYALETLDDRSRDIITHRWLGLEKKTLKELAKKHNVSAERIRQLEQNALANLHQAITDNPS